MKASALSRYALVLLSSFVLIGFSTTVAVALDTDGDGVQDESDNCTLVANNDPGTVPNSPGVLKSQLDSDNDGYGNICDGDLNNSGLTTATDNTLLRNVLNQAYNSSTTAAKADMNGSGLVTATDNTLLRNRLNTAPGPSGAIAAPDTTPNAFSFVDQTNVTASTVITSAAVTITGINAAAAISVVGGTYSIGCGATFTSAAGTISNNQTVCVRHTSAATASTATNTTLTVGGVADTFTSTTVAPTLVWGQGKWDQSKWQ